MANSLVVSGNLTVNGNTTVIESNTLSVGDNIVVLNADLPANTAPTQDAGILVTRGSSTNVQWVWDEALDLTAAAIRRVRDRYGPEALFVHAGST